VLPLFVCYNYYIIKSVSPRPYELKGQIVETLLVRMLLNILSEDTVVLYKLYASTHS